MGRKKSGSRHKEHKIEVEQMCFEPISWDMMITEDSPARAFDKFVNGINVGEFRYAEAKSRGRKPYSPRDMIKLYIYGYFYGIRSSRKLERECKVNIELMWLLGKLTPDDRTIADFRKNNKTALEGIFRQFMMVCDFAGLLGKEVVAIDGSKFRADNSRRQNYTKGKVAKQIQHYEECAKRYLEEMEACDAAEDREENSTITPQIRREELSAKLEEAFRRIAELEALGAQIAENGEISLTDPDSRHMSASNNGTDIAHNVQTAVDELNHLVVAVDVTSEPADSGQLYNMASQAKAELEVDELTVLADKGYYSGTELKKCAENGITAVVSRPDSATQTGNPDYAKDKFVYDAERDVYICPQGKEVKFVALQGKGRRRYRCHECKNCPKRELCTKAKSGRYITRSEYEEVYNEADAAYRANYALYRKRQQIVEHPFGTVKRSMGYTYLLLRRTEGAKAEAYLFFLAYNMKRALTLLGTKGIMEAIAAIAEQNTRLSFTFFAAILQFRPHPTKKSGIILLFLPLSAFRRSQVQF